MMRLTCLIIIMSLAISANAQRSDAARNHLEIHIDPAPMIEYTPRMRIGAGKVKGSRGYCISLGYGNGAMLHSYSFNRNAEYTRAYQMYEARVELKFIDEEKSSQRSYPYKSIEIFYHRITDRFGPGTFYHGDDQATIFDAADYRRSRIGVNAKIGSEIYGQGRIMFELYFGVGLNLRITNYNNLVNPQSSLGEKPDFGIDLSSNEGITVRPTVTLGAKIGLGFWDKNNK